MSPDGRVVYRSGYDGDIRAWAMLGERVVHEAQVGQIETSAHGLPIATSNRRGWIAIWDDADFGVARRIWRGNTDDVPSLALVHGDRLLVSGGNDERARV